MNLFYGARELLIECALEILLDAEPLHVAVGEKLGDGRQIRQLKN
mgnify:CR=1 FL=1